MKKAGLITAICIAIAGCSDIIKNDNCSPEKEISTWTEGKEITVTYDPTYERNNYSIEDGENLVFEYRHSGAQCDDIYDDEWGEVLSFEIDKDLTEFDLTDDAILATKCFYRQYGAWVSHLSYEVKDGRITGHKTAENQWEITVEVTTTPLLENEPPKTITFQQIFYRNN